MVTTMSRAEALAALQQRAAERDQIQANLLELDASFGKRLLERGSLTGTTKVRWAAASADLASVWDVFARYSDLIQRVSELLDGGRRSSGPVLAEASELLMGPALKLTGGPVPLAARQLTGSAQPTDDVTLTIAVQRMTGSFSRVAEVAGATETVWNAFSERLEQIGSLLAPALRQADTMGAGELSLALRAADAELRRVRGLLTSDPLSFWHDDAVDSSVLDQALSTAQAAVARWAEVAALIKDADRRIAETAAKVAAARSCEADAGAVFAAAAQKIEADQLPGVPPTTESLTDRLARLDEMRAAGGWQRLGSELNAIENEAASAAALWQDAGRAAQALLNRRSELRGLLDAYRAKAGRLGAAENADLAAVYQRARDLLRLAPCDLPTAADAVRLYQQAVLGLSGGSP